MARGGLQLEKVGGCLGEGGADCLPAGWLREGHHHDPDYVHPAVRRSDGRRAPPLELHRCAQNKQ